MQTAGLEPEERKASNGRASISQISTEEQPTLISRMTEQLKSMAVRGSIYASFFLAKQPKRIRQVGSFSHLLLND